MVGLVLSTCWLVVRSPGPLQPMGSRLVYTHGHRLWSWSLPTPLLSPPRRCFPKVKGRHSTGFQPLPASPLLHVHIPQCSVWCLLSANWNTPTPHLLPLNHPVSYSSNTEEPTLYKTNSFQNISVGLLPFHVLFSHPTILLSTFSLVKLVLSTTLQLTLSTATFPEYSIKWTLWRPDTIPVTVYTEVHFKLIPVGEEVFSCTPP